MELQNIFTTILNMSITGSIVIGCVLAARVLLKKAPRGMVCALWLAVLLRLLSPVSLTAPVSVLSLVDAPMTKFGAVEYVQMPVQAPLETMSVEPGQEQSAQTVPAPVEAPVDWNLIGTRVWLAGVCGLLGYGIISYVNLKRKLRESVPLEKGVRETDGISSPFVLGRTIYLPAGLEDGERAYILLHERLHIRHGDPAVKLLFWLAVCLHWYNPLVWLSFFLCGRDMELRCDEAVLKRCGEQVRSDYAQSLLDLAAGRHFAPAPLAFGEGDTGRRVKFVLSWKKAKLWIAVPAAVLCAAVLVLTACNPGAEAESPFGHSYRADSSYAAAQIDLPSNTYYTLTSDMGLYIRGEKTELAGFFREVSGDSDALKDAFGDFRKTIRRSWQIEGSGWWLLEKKDGQLQLHNLDQSVTHCLGRVDLLGVTVKQPGMQSHVEPAWYPSDWSELPIEDLAVTLVDGSAEIILTSEPDVEKILVSEEYYELLRDGEYAITVTDTVVERDWKGGFSLAVSRRGDYGDDFAIYRVTVGEDDYAFRLSFPVVPGETAVSFEPEQTRQVTYSEHGVSITLDIPERWSYAITSIDAEELDAGISGGISFWPLGREEGKLFLGWYPDRHAVCGTGLETREMILADQKATVGTYDGRELWDFISFGEYFAVWGQSHDTWWAEYGDEAMEILDSARFEK